LVPVKKFAHFRSGISSVAITGRTYHHILDISEQDHSFHWFLYDESERDSHANTFNIPIELTQAPCADLHAHNPYVAHLQQFHHIPHTATTALELSESSSNNDFAAIMHAAWNIRMGPDSR
jgi:hypothetical protein